MNNNSNPMTYARLEEVLIRLGFVKKATDEFVVFFHESPENILVLPPVEASAKISNWHLLSAQKVISASTSVTRQTLQRMLTRRGASHLAIASELLEEQETDLAAIQ